MSTKPGTVQLEGEVGCVLRYSISREVVGELPTPDQVLTHYRDQLDGTGWQIQADVAGADVAEIVAADGETLIKIRAELFPLGVPRSQQPVEIYVTVTATGLPDLGP